MSRAARWAGLVLLLGSLKPAPAEALRFSLGVATSFTPLTFASSENSADDGAFRFGLMPLLEVEPSRYFAISAYAPFTVLRTGDRATSSGAESVFGLGASLRYPILRAEAPEETLLFATLRGGFGTLDARGGPFLGLALGGATTWMARGIGLYGELSAGGLVIPPRGESQADDIRRLFVGVAFGVLFRLGGEAWEIERRARFGSHQSEGNRLTQGSRAPL